MTAFNLFLIIIGIIVAGYLKCAEFAAESQTSGQSNTVQVWWILSLAISIFGILISLAFWFLDIRNAELVNCGRNTLKELENSLGLTIRNDDESRKYLSSSLDIFSRQIPKSWLFKLIRYGTWLRTIMVFASIIFIIAAIYAIIQILHPEQTIALNASIQNRANIISLTQGNQTSCYLFYE